MALPPFIKIYQGETSVQRFQDNVYDSIQPLLKSTLANTQLVKSVALVTGQDNVVNHDLGKDLVGWLVVRQRSESVVWDSQDSNPIPSRTLVLQCSAAVVVDLLVF